MEHVTVVEIVPSGVGGGVKNGINVSLKNCHKAEIYCVNRKGADGTQCTWTLAQSTGGAGSAAGTNEKALTNNVSMIEYSDGWGTDASLTAASAAKAYQQAITQSITQCVKFTVIPEECMDLAAGFNTIVVNATDPGAANSVYAIALLYSRYTPIPNPLAD